MKMHILAEYLILHIGFLSYDPCISLLSRDPPHLLVQGYNSKREFIAAQGPLPATVDDFWRLVWEQHIPIIVMVTNLKERERVGQL